MGNLFFKAEQQQPNTQQSDRGANTREHLRLSPAQLEELLPFLKKMIENFSHTKTNKYTTDALRCEIEKARLAVDFFEDLWIRDQDGKAELLMTVMGSTNEIERAKKALSHTYDTLTHIAFDKIIICEGAPGFPTSHHNPLTLALEDGVIKLYCTRFDAVLELLREKYPSHDLNP